ncbi:alkaline phosphatase family protein [Cyclobacterium marinum]|uniref:alkaline phosphatase family protein n=1 Tax=Cyclobacterium marinum TaxID=104 RepID=UPI0011EE6C8A|nr:ectonucleotide pyrophosphatase/phosphodiesterase [Cyclobacterium marinum]MBI0400630.1 alkaline phosphatase family protein [Cyclobacterium marinum]
MKKEVVGGLLILIIGTVSFFSCNRKAHNSLQTSTIVNSKASQKKPYLLLISLDGFRWDYLEKYQPPNLSHFVKEGVRSEALIPAYPTKTFPNHYSIVTGMYPDKHGILANSFYSHEQEKLYDYKNINTATDGKFYKGSPIWLEANKANMVTASYFFVGSEADIQGMHPTYYHTYDSKINKEVRVTQVINWLKMPENERPHLITMYFADMDKAGHDYGPGNEQKIKEALFELDRHLGQLFKGVADTGLPVNIVIVSDHGMVDLPASNIIPIESILNDSLYHTVNNGAIVNIYPHQGVNTEALVLSLKQKRDHFEVYTIEDIPGFVNRPKSIDWGAIQLIPDYTYYFLQGKKKELLVKNNIKAIGVHGFDPKHKEMHGIFYAKGPAFKTAFTLPPMGIVHVFPLMCEVLGLPIPQNIDGDLKVVKSVLK